MAILTSLTVNDTGFITLPSGTAEQRPTAAGGLTRFNTNKSRIETYTGTEWTHPESATVLQQPITLPSSNLLLHLDAGNPSSYSGSGTTWNDISGNGRNFTWASTPTFGYDGNIPYFTTLNNLATGPASNSFGLSNTTYTIYVVCRQLTQTQSAAFKFHSSVSGGRGIFSHLAWNNGNVYWDQGGCCGADTRTEVASGGTNNWNIWTFSRFQLPGRSGLQDYRTIYKNSAVLTTNITVPAALNLNSTAANIGGASDEYGGSSSAWNARIAEFIVYGAGLNNGIIGKLRLKYNIGS